MNRQQRILCEGVCKKSLVALWLFFHDNSQRLDQTYLQAKKSVKIHHVSTTTLDAAAHAYYIVTSWVLLQSVQSLKYDMFKLERYLVL